MGQKNSKITSNIERSEEGIVIRSRKDECRGLFKKCFKNNLFSLVPFEVWRDVVLNADAETIVLLSQTCWGFKELVDNAGENNFNLALMFRRQGQICIARKYLYKCAYNDNVLAKFHLGYAFMDGGWGLKRNGVKAAAWFRQLAERESGLGMALMAYNMQFSKDRDEVWIEEVINFWGKKALSSNNSFAVGYCHFFGLGVERDVKLASSLFEKSANEGDEFSQYMLGNCVSELGDLESALNWYLKSAEQGLRRSQLTVASFYRDIREFKNKKLSTMWYKKAFAQD